VAPPCSWSHISHKRFEPALSWQSHFDDNPNKERDEYDAYSRRIKIKSETIQFESNAGVKPAHADAAARAAAPRRRR
jgi:hypothetical protein